jgi:hypothetical protein
MRGNERRENQGECYTLMRGHTRSKKPARFRTPMTRAQRAQNPYDCAWGAASWMAGSSPAMTEERFAKTTNTYFGL